MIRHVARPVLGHYRTPRVLGLDLLRIAACGSIIIFHGNPIRAFGQNWIGSVFAHDGYLGVDVFFVLSGWLLTRQALRMRNAFRSPARFAATFWLRRWMRTLPPYWAVLAGLFAFGGAMGPEPMTPRQLAIHAFLLQSLIPPNRFGVSWSLVAEEWFYLLLPMVIILAPRVGNRRLRVSLAVALLLIPVAVRAALLPHGVAVDLVLGEPPTRFDGLVVGSLLAAASLRAPWWPWVVARRRILFAGGCLGLVGLLAAGVEESQLSRVVGLLAFSLLVGALLPQLSQLRWPAAAPMTAMMATAFLSELTYPLYLLHELMPNRHWVHATGPMRFVLAAGSLITLLVVAAAFHLGVERPFLALRDRYVARRDVPVARASWREPTTAGGRPAPVSRPVAA